MVHRDKRNFGPHVPGLPRSEKHMDIRNDNPQQTPRPPPTAKETYTLWIPPVE